MRLAAWVFPLVVLAAGNGWCAERLRLAYSEDSALGLLAAQVLARVFDQAGVGVDFVARPVARATREALAGELDGEVARIRTYGDDKPELQRVEPAFLPIRVAVYAKEAKAKSIRSVRDLERLPVGIVRGNRFAALATQGLPQVGEVVRPKQLFEMLQADRFDAVVDSDINGRLFLPLLDKAHDIRIAVLLHDDDGYVYLHQRHAAVAARIGKVIQESKGRREMDKWLRAAEVGVCQHRCPVF